MGPALAKATDWARSLHGPHGEVVPLGVGFRWDLRGELYGQADSQLALQAHPVVTLTRSWSRPDHVLYVLAPAGIGQSVQVGHHSTMVLAGWSANAGQANTHRR